ncbi:MAG: ABC transporter ATP-binding protein/permease [Alphaproteobacteria bacterium]
MSFDPNADAAGGGSLRALGTLLRYLWPAGKPGLKLRVVLALACLAAAKLTLVYVPFLYKAVVDALDKPAEQAIAVPVLVIVGYGVARVFTQAFGELRDAIFARVGQNAMRNIALSVFRHLHGLPLQFHLDRRTGGLSRVIERGVKAIDFLLRFSLFNILPTLLEIGMVAGILMWNYGIAFAGTTLVAVGAYIFFTFSITEWRLKYRREMNNTDSIANTRAIDSLLNFETVKYFGNEEYEARRFDEAMARYEKAAVLSQVTLSLLNIGQGVIIALGMGSVMWLAAVGVRDGTMTLGDFVLVNTFMMQLYQPLGFLGFVYREIKQSLVDMDKMFELVRVKSQICDRPDAAELAVDGGAIEFDHVSFAYDTRRPILRDVSFTVPAGKTVAVVGASGAGKSTLSRLLFRFYDIDEGAIRIDGQDIRDVTQASLRSAIGIVPQDTVMFNESIEYNIRYGRPEAERPTIEEAARMARIERLIGELPAGYDSMVGERGLKLSGGEKQRMAIARTILKRPKIMVFDEATSALDTGTEKEIQASLKELSADATTLVIAHRLSTVVDADEILVLDHGRIVERGGHSELLAADGVYAELWRRQQQEAEALKLLEAVAK